MTVRLTNKTEHELRLELCVARLETCLMKKELLEAMAQLLQYQSQENKQLYESLRQLDAELAPQTGAALGAETPTGEGEQPDPLRKLTHEQAVIIAGYTGIAACKLTELREDISARKGQKITSAAMKKFTRAELAEMYKADFAKLCPVKNPDSKNKLTEEQAIIVTGYTGKLLGDMNAFLADLGKRLGRKIVNSELPSIGQEKISILYKEDFSLL